MNSKEKLAEMHEALADALINRLKSNDLNASDMNVARQFLKDNQFEPEDRQNERFQSLFAQLPTFEDDEY